MAKKGWSSKTLALSSDHAWRAPKGYVVLVLDRGAAHICIPATWVVSPGEGAIDVHDKPPPDDDCVLQISTHRIPIGIDFSGLPVSDLLEGYLNGPQPERNVLARGEVQTEHRGDLQVSWAETRFMDEPQNREACSRIALGRRLHVQALITLAYWPEDLPRIHPIWATVLQTLRIAEFVADPVNHRLH